MRGNDYEGLFERREIRLIRQWAERGGLAADAIPDLLQEMAMVALQQPGRWPPAGREQRGQMLWTLIRKTVRKLMRAEQRRRRRDEEKASRTEEAYWDNTTPRRLDVQEVVAGLDEPCQTVCKLLSQGLSKRQIANRMQCNWYVLEQLLHTIREQFEAAEVNAWLQ